jgi:PAS domain S-box-containing protein
MKPVTMTDSTARTLLCASREILLLVDGCNMKIVDANAAAVRLLGYPEVTLIGMGIADVECALSDLFFWDEMQDLSVASADSEYRCADGTVLQVAKEVSRVSLQPLYFSVCATVSAQDNKVASELNLMGSRLRATLEATADGILLVDNDGAILNMNRRFSALWNVPEVLLLNSDDAGIMAHLQAQIAAEVSQDASFESTTAGEDFFETQYLQDGRVFECSSHSARSGEELIGRVYSYRDVTERYRAQDELIAARDDAKRASQAKGDFLAMMSHEIRTPMNGVLGIAQLLTGTQLNEEQAGYLRIIRSSGETLLAILNDILDYSKIEAGKLELERTDFALAPLLDEISALFRFRVTASGPTFVCALAPDAPARVRGDSVRLRQILFNLVGNAFKFTERGSITVTVSSQGATSNGANTLRFSVRDTGIGIPADRQAGVFEAFEQAEASTNRRFGGTGLGLSICRRLVLLMGGEIGLNSVVGEGSEFWFTAQFETPAAQIPVSTVTASHALASGTMPAKVLTAATRILLVEDNMINRMVISGMLKRMGGAEPAVAGNGEEALARVKQSQQDNTPFDLILMDTQMPVMDGLEATRKLRALGVTLPIIGVSAGAMDEERQAGLDAGMDEYLLKPVNMDALAVVLTRALSH